MGDYEMLPKNEQAVFHNDGCVKRAIDIVIFRNIRWAKSALGEQQTLARF
jgi:hypothetical protein